MSRFTRRVSCATPMLLASLAGPAVATPAPPAADFAYDTAGQLGNLANVVGISQDGSDVLFNHLPDATSLESELLSRDLRTNTTSRVLPAGDTAWSASANNQRVLYRTTKALDPADRNTTADFYVLDRRTGVSTVVSRLASGLAAGSNPSIWNSAALSGDGNTVVYDQNNGGSPWVMRYAPATGVVSSVGPGPLMSDGRLDTAGSEVMTDAGLVTHGTTVSIPFTPPTDYHHVTRRFRFSPDGSAMAEERTTLGAVEVIVTSAVTGAHSTFPLPPTDRTLALHLLGVSNGGDAVTVARAATDPATNAAVDAIDSIDTTGAVTPIATLPSYGGRGPSALLSADGAFVADTQVFQIAASTGPGPVPAPIPAVQAAATPAPKYVTFYPGCAAGSVLAPVVRPSVVLASAPVSPSPRTPDSATLRVIFDAKGARSMTYSLKAGARQSLMAGWGGFWLVTTVAFTDGTTATGTQHIAAYTPIKNDTNPFSSAKGACKIANGL